MAIPTINYKPEFGLPPAYNAPADRESKLQEWFARHEVPVWMQQDTLAIAELEYINIVIDNSGSMNSIVSPPGFPESRWDELHKTLDLILELLLAIPVPQPTDGAFVRAWLLNPVPGFNNPVQLYSPADLNGLFGNRPAGYTPLVQTLKSLNLFELPPSDPRVEQKILTLVFTDGEPYVPNSQTENIANMSLLLQKRHAVKLPISVILCTSDQDTTDKINQLDNLPSVDIVDDYQSEYLEVQKAGNKLTLGMYIIKCLIGSMNARYDNLDQCKVNLAPVKPADPVASQGGSCCNIS